MFYLKEVRLLLSEAARRGGGEDLGDFVRKIKENGIKCQMVESGTGQFKAGELEIEEDGAGTTDVGHPCAGTSYVDDGQEGVLWITDQGEIAEWLAGKGCAILIYLHEGNHWESFAMCKYACEDLSGETDVDYLDRVYRRCRGLPWDILWTPHCLVRETTVADVADFYRIYREPSITEYMDKLYEDPEEERRYAQDYIDQVYSFYNFGIWTVVERESGEVIGRAGICYREGYEDPELGFVIGVPWQGKGYATEVCREILRYAGGELGFRKILAFVQPGNLASLRVCEKLGMESLGEVVYQDQVYEVKIYS